MESKEVETLVHKHVLPLNEQIKAAFRTVQEEFEDHLDAINENTQELQHHHDAISELNRKLEKINERIDEMQLMIKQVYMDKRDISLNFDEQKIFLLLYTHENGYLSFDEISAKTGFSPDYTRSMINSMLDKGISMIREIIDAKLFFRLNPRFRAMQAKENIVQIEPAVVRQFENRMLGSFF
ncbi:hypothetical protein COV19_00405 [Candidatus Woesearchaeota archaeon CG10_big_fil_rev_8_21_14_0_10_44_13]|nr:MAG: hypothetical protein COV19_00405 [Candidatus Woesearchaeota archaeon CG10_big_fil_rev_8_21_14_0_10_44_13]